jgi:hypothetical protein
VRVCEPILSALQLPAGAQQHVDMPVAPTVEQGHITVTISAMTQVGRSEVIHNITVLVSNHVKHNIYVPEKFRCNLKLCCVSQNF